MRLVARGVEVERGGRKVLGGIDLEVMVPEAGEPGKFVVICAPQAQAGLALLRVLAGLQAPQVGSVRYLGQNVYEAGQSLKQNLGYVPAGELVPGSLKVERALGYAAELRLAAQDPEARAARVGEVMEELGLGSEANRRVDRLDVGSFFRVKLAVERLSGARILMVDGQGAGRQDADRVRSYEILRELCGQGGVSVVCVVGGDGGALARRYCDAIYELRAGVLDAL